MFRFCVLVAVAQAEVDWSDDAVSLLQLKSEKGTDHQPQWVINQQKAQIAAAGIPAVPADKVEALCSKCNCDPFGPEPGEILNGEVYTSNQRVNGVPVPGNLFEECCMSIVGGTAAEGLCPTADAAKLGPHQVQFACRDNHVSFQCEVPDGGFEVWTNPAGTDDDEAGDEAEATGDPHLTTNTGAHFDLQLAQKHTLGEEKGNPTTRRATPDGATNIEFVDTGAGGFDSAGKLDKVTFYAQRAGNKGLRFRIYRPSGGGYSFVAQTEEIAVPTAGVIQEYSFSEKVPFLAGDYIGWSHTGNGNIPFDGTGSNVFWNYGIINDGCSTVPNDGTQPRTYSYMISTVPASAADYAAGELCGADVPEGLVDEGAAVGDPHLTYGGKHRDVKQADVHHSHH